MWQAENQQFARFGGQRPPNLRIRIVELSTPPKLARVIFDALALSQADAQVLEQSDAILGALLASLLELLDVTTDSPVPKRQANIDRE